MAKCSGVSFGLYFGNTSCCIAVNRNGKVDVVANGNGDRVTPSVVGFLGNEVVVGTSAKQALIKHSSCLIAGALRSLCSTATDDVVFPLSLNFKLTYESEKPTFHIENLGKSFVVTAEVVLKHVLLFLKDVALSYDTGNILPLVISVPAWVTGSTLALVHHLATTVGFHVLSTVIQPAAACLAYNLLDSNLTDFLVLVFHCGGSSTVASVAHISGGLLCIKESCSSRTAGEAFTSVLVNHFAQEFYMRYKGDPLENKRSTRKLYIESENCKHVLSTVNTAQLHVESLWEGVDFSTHLSRARFDGLIFPALNEIFSPLRELLLKVGLDKDRIKKVILTGGSCKIPRIQKLVCDEFPHATVLKGLQPDEVSAIGAALESSFCLERDSDKPLSSNPSLACLSTSIYAKILNTDASECVFAFGTPILSRRSISLECPGPGSLLIYEGKQGDELDGAAVEENQHLAQVDLHFASYTKMHIDLDFLLKSAIDHTAFAPLLASVRLPIQEVGFTAPTVLTPACWELT